MVRHQMYPNSSSEISLEGSRVKPVRNRFSGWKIENGKESDNREAFMKNLKIACLANSWMAKTVVKVFPRGKGFLVRACEGSEVAMK